MKFTGNKPAHARTAFTLLEILLASVAAAMILVIINAVFVRAIHLRDDVTERVRDTRLRARAEHAIRDDLQCALVSGGVLASTLDGGTNSTSGPGGASFPGYLRLTTTNGHSASGTVASDVQQVEYYVVKDPKGSTVEGTANSGVLVRAITRDLLATTPTVAKEETLLSSVQSLQVQFYDGTNWVDTWEFDSDTAAASANTGSSGTTVTTGNTTLPEAIRVDVRRAPKAGGVATPPVEVLVPWTAQPFVGATPSATGSNGAGPGNGNTTNPEQGNGPQRPGEGPGGRRGDRGPGGERGPGEDGPPGGRPPGGRPPEPPRGPIRGPSN